MNEKFKNQMQDNMKIHRILFKDKVLDIFINEIDRFLSRIHVFELVINKYPKNYTRILVNKFAYILKSDLTFIIPHVELEIIKIRQPGFYVLEEYCERAHEFVKIYKKYLEHKIRVFEKMKVDDKYE